jgi:hypothetical protein
MLGVQFNTLLPSATILPSAVFSLRIVQLTSPHPSVAARPMSSLAPLAPTYRPGDTTAAQASREAAALAADAAASHEPNVFTDAQIDEYKEQDRYLPVSSFGSRPFCHRCRTVREDPVV